jgi:O-glycosyl hydrolase
MKLLRLLLLLALLLQIEKEAFAQRYPNTGIKVKVMADQRITIHFDRHLRHWDGFGVNYVEACQTRDYSKFQQDYSGFSFASEASRTTVMELIFGEAGLKPGLTKMFLDPYHEGMTKEGNDNDDPMKIDLNGFDHKTTTEHMRFFNREGRKMMKEWGGDFQTIVTLYGPAPWMTRQKYVLGRDLDAAEKCELAEYMASWAMYLREEEDIPVKYISFHNEGDAYYRWPRDGSNPGEDHRDYNMYWPPEQVVDFLKITRQVLDANDMHEIGLSPGETQTWFRFDKWGYASAIVHDSQALNNLDIITSHSFAFLDEPQSVYYGDYRSIGQDLIHSRRPKLPVWVTSRPWTQGPDFVENLRRDIYESKANGIIPWALIAGANQWMESNGEYSDGSMKAAFNIREDGSLTIQPGYHYYKQISRAGQPGMQVAEVINLDPSLGAIAFAGADSKHPNAFLIINKSEIEKVVEITLTGTEALHFQVYRTSEAETYDPVGRMQVADRMLKYAAPARSVTTFYEAGL